MDYEDIPAPTFADPDATIRVPTHHEPQDSGEPDPRYLAEYLRTWGLRLLYWQVIEAYDVDEQSLNVVYSNGKETYLAGVCLASEVIYDLFDMDGSQLPEDVLEHIAVTLIEERVSTSDEFPGDDWNTTGYSTVNFTDRELVAAGARYFTGPVGALLTEIAGMMRDLPLGLSSLDPRSRIAAKATEIVWEVL